MTDSLYDITGAYIGPVPEWLTIPEAREGYRDIHIPVASRKRPDWFAREMLNPTELMVTTMSFAIGRHRNGARKLRILTQETADLLEVMRKEAEKWF